MKWVLFFLKKTTNFIQFDFICLKVFKSVAVPFVVSCFLIICGQQELLKSQKYLHYASILMFCLYVVVWLFFGFVFQTLKMQNFFIFFTLNRSFFNLKMEILSFLSSFFVLLCFVYSMCLPFVENEIFFKIIALSFFALIDAVFSCFIQKRWHFLFQVCTIIPLLQFGVKFSVFPLFLRAIIEFLVLEKNIIRHVRNK